MRAFIVDMDNVPGSLATLAAAIAAEGANITGVAAVASGGAGVRGGVRFGPRPLPARPAAC